MDLLHKFPLAAGNVLHFEKILYPIIFSLLQSSEFLLNQPEYFSAGLVIFLNMSMKSPSEEFLNFFSEFLVNYLSEGSEKVLFHIFYIIIISNFILEIS